MYHLTPPSDQPKYTYVCFVLGCNPKKLYLALVDLEKVFDNIPKEVLRWVMKTSVLDELLVQAATARTVARTRTRQCSFKVNVRVNLLAIALDEVTKEDRGGIKTKTNSGLARELFGKLT